MTLLSRRCLRRLAAAGLLLMMSSAPVSAQTKKGEEPLPPWDVAALPRERAWVQWVFAFLFVAGVAGLAFKNPHRTHLD
jgi:hypothetical protein